MEDKLSSFPLLGCVSADWYWYSVIDRIDLSSGKLSLQRSSKSVSVSLRFWPAIDSALRAAACTREVQVRLLVSCWKHSPAPMFTFLQSLLVLNRPSLKCDIDVVRWEIWFQHNDWAAVGQNGDASWTPCLFLFLCRKFSQWLQQRSRWRFPLHESIMPSTWWQTEWST